MTGTGMLIGTPGFMSPEQASGTPVSPASDVFSLGGVLTFAANGVGPFGDGNPVVMIYRVVHEQPTLTGLTPTLAQLVSRCLVKRVEERARLPELMEIITANMTPVLSATSFWPGALARFIGSYQAGFAADTRAWSPSAPVTAEPSPPPFQAFQAERALTDAPADPRGSGDLPVPTGVAADGGERDEPPTITAYVATPTPPLRSGPPPPPPTPPIGREPTPASASASIPPGWESPTAEPALAPAAYQPTPTPTPPTSAGPTWGPSPVAPVPLLPADQPPAPKPSRPLFRPLAIIIGSVVLVLGALGITLALTGSHSNSTTQGGGGGSAENSPPGGFGTIPAEFGTPHAGTVRFGVPQGDGPTWILPIVTAAQNIVYNTTYFEYQMWRPLYWTTVGVSRRSTRR